MKGLRFVCALLALWLLLVACVCGALAPDVPAQMASLEKPVPREPEPPAPEKDPEPEPVEEPQPSPEELETLARSEAIYAACETEDISSEAARYARELEIASSLEDLLLWQGAREKYSQWRAQTHPLSAEVVSFDHSLNFGDLGQFVDALLPEETRDLTPHSFHISRECAALDLRGYRMESGDRVLFGSLRPASHIDGAVIAEFPIETGDLRIYTEADGWVRMEAVSGARYDTTAVILNGENGSSIMAYTPSVWEDLDNESKRLVADGGFAIADAGGRLYLQLLAPAMEPACSADFTVVTSNSQLLDWDLGEMASIWRSYASSGNSRWNYRGYYYPAPSTYVPTGENVYYHQVSAYLTRSLLYLADKSPLCYDLSLCMLERIQGDQNEPGFFPTQSQSEWLMGDYTIGKGFYDTRFNTDLIGSYLKAYRDYGYFEDVLRTYTDFFLDYAAAHSRETESGGRFVDDYYNPTGGEATHCSLNHQIAQAILLYQIADAMGRDDAGQLADQMLLAVEDTAENWIKADGSLHYAFYRDGSYGGQDYPVLTYNDLYDMQTQLTSMGRPRSEKLDEIMASKLQSMIAAGITDYRGYVAP